MSFLVIITSLIAFMMLIIVEKMVEIIRNQKEVILVSTIATHLINYQFIGLSVNFLDGTSLVLRHLISPLCNNSGFMTKNLPEPRAVSWNMDVFQCTLKYIHIPRYCVLHVQCYLELLKFEDSLL